MVEMDVLRHRHATPLRVSDQGAQKLEWEIDMKGIFTRTIRGAAIIGALFIGGFMADTTPSSWVSKGSVVSQAEAIVGRPATPGSYAGVARRTTGRAVRWRVY